MTMTDERLEELDAVMANTTKREWSADGLRDNRIVWSGPDTRVCFMAIYPKAHADSLAIVALHNVYPDLRAHIEAQGATIARLETEMRALIRGYVSLMETGRDRIIGLGGKCDSMERMEGVDPYLRAARAALTGAA